jgi:hypothetical protein
MNTKLALIGFAMLVMTAPAIAAGGPYLGNDWILENQPYWCPLPLLNNPPPDGCSKRRDFARIQHLKLKPNSKFEFEDKVIFGCGTEPDSNKMSYWLSYVLDDSRLEAPDLTRVVKFTIDGQKASIKTTAHGRVVALADLSDADFALLLPAKTIQIDVQGNRPYVIKDQTYGLSDFKVFCDLQLSHVSDKR